MTHFKTFSRSQQFFIVFLGLMAFLTLVSFRHFTVAFLWTSGVVLFVFKRDRKDFLKKCFKTIQHPGFYILFCLLIWAFLTSFWSIKPLQGLKATFSQTLTLGLIAVLLTHFSHLKKESFSFLIKISMILIIISSVFIFIQMPPLKNFKEYFSQRGFVTLKTNMTLLLIVSIPICAHYHMVHRKKLIPIILLLIAFILCYRTSYQAGMYGIVLGGLGAGIGYRFSHFIPMLSAYLSAFLCLTLPLIFHFTIPLMNLQYLWENYSVTSLIHRLYLWDFVTKRVEEKIILGWGAATSRGFPSNNATVFESNPNTIFPSHTHNHIMQIWLEMGGVGAIILAILHFAIFKTIADLESKTATAWAMFFSTASFVILSLSHSIWHKWWITWFGAAIALFIVIINNYVSNKKSVGYN